MSPRVTHGVKSILRFAFPPLVLATAVVTLTLACSDSRDSQSTEQVYVTGEGSPTAEPVTVTDESSQTAEPVIVTEEGSPTAEPESLAGPVLTAEQFRSLLSVQEVQAVLTESQGLKETQFLDIKRLIADRDVEQTFPMDSGFSLFFVNHDGSKSIRVGVFDLESPVAASNQYEEVKDQTAPELEVMEPPIGHASAQMEANAAGIGSNIVFLRSDILVTLHTGMPEGTEPLTDLAGLRELAKLIDERIRRD